MELTAKQQKFFVWCGVIAAVWYVVSYVVDSVNRAAYYRQQAIRAAQRQKAKPKPKPAPPEQKTLAAPAAPTAPVIARVPVPAVPARPKPAPPSPYAKFSGVWRGRVALDGRGICDLSLELREKQDSPGHFSGYSTMTCSGTGPLMAKKVNPRMLALNRMDPEAAILSGAMENGSIEFRTDKVVGSDSNGCAPASFNLTPFGANQLAAEWQENACEGGRMILRKTRQ